MRQSRWWLRAPVLVAPDKFKGTMTAAEVATAIASGIRDGGRNAEELPVADGGDGTAEVLLRALGGEWVEAEASDPLGRRIQARFAMLADGRAVVEAAEASGLARLGEDELDPWGASSRGTGELIAAAAEAGATTILVAVGGTATVEGGAGALEALPPEHPPITCICDVRTPWERAAAVYGPQKGADAALVKRLAGRMADLGATGGPDPCGVPMTGAGGGIAGGLWMRAGARLVPGAPFVLDALGFDDHMRRAAFVVTGEGRLDPQTLEGKAAGEVAVRCRQAGVACHAIVGSAAIDEFSIRVLALDGLAEAGDPGALALVARSLA